MAIIAPCKTSLVAGSCTGQDSQQQRELVLYFECHGVLLLVLKILTSIPTGDIGLCGFDPIPTDVNASWLKPCMYMASGLLHVVQLNSNTRTVSREARGPPIAFREFICGVCFLSLCVD